MDDDPCMADDPFAAPEKAIRWAKEAISELEQEFDTFSRTYKHSFDTRLDPLTGRVVQVFRVLERPSEKLERQTTEALLNTKHSFDQALYAASAVILGRPPKKTNFPWRNNPADLERYIRNTKDREIPAGLWDVLRKHEPFPLSSDYQGGNTIIRELARIANDKHTIGLSCLAAASRNQIHIAECGPDLKIENRPWDYKRQELILATHDPASRVNVTYGVMVDIVLDVEGPLKGYKTIWLLKTFAEKAEQVISDLKGAALAPQ